MGWAIDPNTTDWIYVWTIVDGVGRHQTPYLTCPDGGADGRSSGRGGLGAAGSGEVGLA
jgi:hypothetical protein